MYLSRLVLNVGSRDAQRDLASPYEMHRTLARVFPGSRADAQGANADRQPGHGLLFRAEPDAAGGLAVLVQSLAPPDWRALPDGYVRRVDGPTAFDPQLRKGQRLRFRLVANPTVKKKVDGRTNGTRVPLVHPRAPSGHPEVAAGYLDWLERKAGDAGVSVDLDQTLDAPFEVRFSKSKGRGQAQRVSLFGVRFDGVLTVDDPSALADSVRSGVGPAKGFGFGLLSLART